MRSLAAVMLCAAAMMPISRAQEAGNKLIQASDCSSCHDVSQEVVGPAYGAIAKRHAGDTDAVEKLAAKIREGGNGMPAHPDLTDVQRREMAKWILATDVAAARAPETFSHTLKDGTTVNLDFPVYDGGKGLKVTKGVFHGYQLFNSYCYRCHGTDATGGQLAPDLRRSLATGMTRQEFLSVVAAGKTEKGMPAWAGFLSADDLVHIYQYSKGRSLDLVPSGRPPSTQD